MGLRPMAIRRCCSQAGEAPWTRYFVVWDFLPWAHGGAEQVELRLETDPAWRPVGATSLRRPVVPAGTELRDLHRSGGEHAHLVDGMLLPGRHETDELAVSELAIDDSDVADHSSVGVVVRVEHQRPKRSLRVSAGGGNLLDDLLEQFFHAGAGLRRDPEQRRRVRDITHAALGRIRIEIVQHLEQIPGALDLAHAQVAAQQQRRMAGMVLRIQLQLFLIIGKEQGYRCRGCISVFGYVHHHFRIIEPDSSGSGLNNSLVCLMGSQPIDIF